MNQKYYNEIYMHGTDIWPYFYDKHIFVAGHRGFYGKWIYGFLEYLRDATEQEIYLTGRSARDGFDILSAYKYPFDSKSFDVAINCSGYPDASDPRNRTVLCVGPAIFRDNIGKKTNMLHISSGAVSCKSSTEYGRAKALSEKILLLSEDYPVKIVRPFNTIGPGMNLEGKFAISAFITSALKNEPLRVTDHQTTRSFCHIVDLIIQMFHVIVNGRYNHPYEIGSDDPLTITEAAGLISDNLIFSREEFPTNANSDYYVADISKVRSEFNLDLLYSSKSAILDTLNFYKNVAVKAP